MIFSERNSCEFRFCGVDTSPMSTFMMRGANLRMRWHPSIPHIATVIGLTSFLCLTSGCIVAVPLCSQLTNMESDVCPMPMPACKAVFEWDDDFGYRPLKPTDAVPADNYEITAGDVLMAVWSVPVYVCCYVVPCIASDVFFSPYNVPAYLYYKDRKGMFELAEGDHEYVLSWRGLHANRVESKIIVVIERGHVDFLGKTTRGELFEKRLGASCDLKATSGRVMFGCTAVPRGYGVSCRNDQENGEWGEEFSDDARIRFELSDDFQGNISLVDELQ